MLLYKLTDSHDRTYGFCQWGENVTHEVVWSGKFCGVGVIHCYTDLTLALMLNPIHGNFESPRVWQAQGDILLSDNELKFGVARLTTLKEILPLPQITIDQRIKFGIMCALAV